MIVAPGVASSMIGQPKSGLLSRRKLHCIIVQEVVRTSVRKKRWRSWALRHGTFGIKDG